MGDVIRDIHKNVTLPIIRTVDEKQKSLRKGVVRIIDVGEEDKRSQPTLPAKKDEAGKKEDLFSLESLRHWDVTMPPIKKKRFGLPVPGVKSTINKVGLGKVFKKKRRITIELYKKITPEQAAMNKEREKRVFQKLYSRASTVDLSVLNEDCVPPLEDEDFILFRILKERKSGAKDWHDDDSLSAASHLPNGALESHMLTTYNVTDYGDGHEESGIASHWKERHRSRISTVEINNVESRLVELKIGVGEEGNVVRELCFEDSHEVETFVRTFDKMRELIMARGSRMAAQQRMVNINNMGKKSPARKKGSDNVDNVDGSKKRVSPFSSLTFGSKVDEDCESNSVDILVEIVSATNLPIADITSSDPYVCVEDGRKRLHKTDVVTSTLHPVWTLSTGSMFLIQTTLTDFFALASRIEFVVKDYDTVGANDTLGSVLVKKKDLLEGNGERVEHVLTLPKNKEMGKKKSYLTLRYKQATEDDINFLRSYEAKKATGLMSALGLSSNTTGVFAEDCYLPPRPHPSTYFKKNEKKAHDGIAVKYRLKPFPDPAREAETKWLSEAEIQTEVNKPSQDWIEAGSGSVGKFYLEILGCDGLPNLDFDPSGRNKSDPFVLITFEDCVVNTDVINDCLAPRWMPWTQRAFVFNVMHPSSQFYIAVMDYEGIKGHHDKIGRAIINPTNLRPDTMYTMRYSLLDSDEIGQKSTGKIMFRLRFESSTERQFLLSTFQWRKDYYVSTTRRADCQTMSFALTNDHDRYYLSLETIQKYLDELIDYQLYIEDIVRAFEVVILWRGHFPLSLSFFGKTLTVKAPFHSMTAFTWAILLSYDFDRFGSFMCFSVAWILFAMLEVQRSNPNPWKRPRTYIDLLGTLLFNKSFAYHKIERNENIEEIMTFDERRNHQMKFRKEIIETSWARNEQEERKLEKENKELDKQSRDKTVGLSYGPSRLFLGPFQDILIPVQKILYNACVSCRVVKSVVVWSDSVVSFWVATIALVLTALLFFVPWTFLFRWTFRIVSILFTGPWMKLVDIFFVENTDDLTYEERKAKIEAEMQERYDFVLGESRIRRLFKERTMKIRDMERYLFGQYGVRVPLFKEERFASTPLSGGFAEPYNRSSEPPPNIIRRINGQVLKGDMIMERQDPAKEFKSQKAQKKVLDSQIPTVISTEDEMAPLINDKGDDYPYGALNV